MEGRDADADGAGGSARRTRRDALRYGGTVAAGGLLAGCVGGGGQGDDVDRTGAGGNGSTAATGAGADDGEASGADGDATEPYTVSMEPMGEVAFEEPPETWVAFLSTYGDMGIALGQQDGLAGLWNPDDVPTTFYDALPGVDVALDDVTALEGEDGFDKETFYAVDADVHLVDPNWLAVLADGWSDEDTEEIVDSVGPFLGNYIRRRGDDWHDYRYYDLYDAFEIVAEAFREPERYEALRDVHDGMLTEIRSTLPATEDRPTVGLLSVNSDFEDGAFWVYPLQEGNNHKQYRDLRMRGTFDPHIDGSYAKWDYEQLLEVDPDALVFQYGFSHVTADEFDEKTAAMRDDPVGGELSAVKDDRLYRGGASYQGPIVNLFQTEAAARQFYPDTYGEWDGVTTLAEEELSLFDRARVADIVAGEI